MRNILARGGIEFLAVLLGITSSLWIDNNKKLADIESERIVVHQIPVSYTHLTLPTNREV